MCKQITTKGNLHWTDVSREAVKQYLTCNETINHNKASLMRLNKLDTLAETGALLVLSTWKVRLVHHLSLGLILLISIHKADADFSFFFNLLSIL